MIPKIKGLDRGACVDKIDHETFVSILLMSKPSIDRTMFFYKWKNKHYPEIGCFSVAHGGDPACNFIQAISSQGLDWPETAIINGKKEILEYERNFNLFVATMKRTIVERFNSTNEQLVLK